MRILALAALLAHVAAAQAQPDAAEILRKVGDTYSNAKRYHFVVKSVVAGGSPTTIEIAVEPPNKFRIDAGASLLGGEDEMGRMMLISDGAQVWTYASGFNQYTIDKIEQPEPGAAPAAGESPFVRQFAMLLFYRYVGFAKNSAEARLLRQETIEAGGGMAECYVIEIKSPENGGDYTWWVDQKRFLVLREDTKPADASQPPSSVVFTVAQLNEPLAEDLFQFTPPAGAKLVDELGVL
jgi:outer membrane lipoprotein-sorting protein